METRREGRSMALRRTAMAGDVLACEFDADNPDLQVRWDNTLRYKLATRVERGDNKLDRSAVTIGAGLSYRRNTPLNAQFLGAARCIAETGGMRQTNPLPDREWTANALAGAGIR